MTAMAFTQAVWAKADVTSTDELSEATFAVQTGTTCGTDAETHFPNAQIDYYNTLTDILTVMRTGKADATVCDIGVLRFLQIDNKDIVTVGDIIEEIKLAPAFPKTDKGQALCDEYSEFVRQLWDDGTMKELDDAWFGDDESKRQVIDYENLPDTNGTLTMAVDASIVPFAYVKDNRIVGYDVDVAARFCKAKGYRLEISNMSFD
jgi:polar amino acid transport system substrate-binding protein